MKRVKMLLVAMLCVVMAFGAVSVPVSAEAVSSNEEPEEMYITIHSIQTDKVVYHSNEDIKLSFNLYDTDRYDVIGDNYGDIESITLSDGKNSYTAYYNKENKLFQCIIKGRAESFTFSMSLHINNKSQNIKYRINYKNSMVKIIVNDNCANNIHLTTTSWKLTQPVNCGHDGEKIKYCNICGQIAERKIIPKRGEHEPGELYVCKQPTYDEEGEKWIICNKCNMLLYSEKIPKLQRPQQNTKQPNKIITTSKLKFKKKSITIKKGKSIKLKYTRKPVNAQDTLSWKSSKPKVVKILKNGKVKGIKKGKSVITLKTSTEKKAKITIKVK